ncbi:hypothetical protein [Pseudoalteromonas sp. MMG012]|uniref:hypothetical protein n=1 Tax=Pseudoalteromonas sp. MMG012 TaxID=2822686 RepID=UPI001B3A5CA7|nr:hypothetical protein [Pseudoalteromonas sp. MMG012]MBQ4850178.1 hypothetical protein [Pseudoalteromonas sp. MMG012]
MRLNKPVTQSEQTLAKPKKLAEALVSTVDIVLGYWLETAVVRAEFGDRYSRIKRDMDDISKGVISAGIRKRLFCTNSLLKPIRKV